MNNKKYSHMIFADPGYSMVTLGCMFFGILVMWLLNNLILLPWLAGISPFMRDNNLMLSTLNNLLLFMAVPFFYFRRRHIDHRIFTGLGCKPDRRSMFLSGALALGCFVFTSALQTLWFLLLQKLGIEYAGQDNTSANIFVLILGLLLRAIAPAISEEYLFRGVLLRSMQGRYGRWRAIFASSALFSLMHMNISSLPTTFVVGIATGYVLSTTNCLQLSMLMHFIHNAGGLILSFIFGILPLPESGTGMEAPAIGLAIYAVFGLLIILVSSQLIRRMGILRRSTRVTNAALPQGSRRDWLPLAVSAAIMLIRMI